MHLLEILKSCFFLDTLKLSQKIKLPFSTSGRRYLADLLSFKKQAEILQSDFKFGEFLPCVEDYSSQSAHLPQHYFYQDLLVASKIFKNNPDKHVDIGSRIDGFIAHVASFRKVEVLDIRPLNIDFDNIIFKQGDLMGELDLEGYSDSISSLHVIEHFGLGRYNDPIDFKGYLKGLDNIYKMLKVGGKFYFSVPIGKEQVVFNAHRVFSVKYLVELFQSNYQIDSFSYIDDVEKMVVNASIDPVDLDSYLFDYGCGIFELTKLS
jgi:hypothetical protein